jgi:hypothetical protein
MNIASSQKGSADLLNRLHAALHVIVQANCSMGAAAKEVKSAEHVQGVLCPEFVMPLLVKATSESLATCFQILDEIEALGGEKAKVAP